jgi:hypothetical protein
MVLVLVSRVCRLMARFAPRPRACPAAVLVKR